MPDENDMMDEGELTSVLAALSPSARQPLAATPLHGGQTLVRLYLVRYAWGDAVLKGPLQPREASFYGAVAPRLAAEGIAVPIVYEQVTVEGGEWVLREAFPALLPMRRWFGDTAVMATLHQLHALGTDFAIPQPFIPTWRQLTGDDAATLPALARAQLDALVARHADLLAPTCVVAGDPNATNWGVRADGTVVLFDWDRVGYGVPAHDVAIVLPQLGYPTFYQQIAAAYLRPDASPEAIARFAHAMAISKVQTTIDYITTPGITEENRHFVLGLLPSWLAMLTEMDDRYHAQYD